MEGTTSRVDRSNAYFAGEYVVDFAHQDGKFASARFDLSSQVGASLTFGCDSQQLYVPEWLSAATIVNSKVSEITTVIRIPGGIRYDSWWTVFPRM